MFSSCLCGFAPVSLTILKNMDEVNSTSQCPCPNHLNITSKVSSILLYSTLKDLTSQVLITETSWDDGADEGRGAKGSGGRLNPASPT